MTEPDLKFLRAVADAMLAAHRAGRGAELVTLSVWLPIWAEYRAAGRDGDAEYCAARLRGALEIIAAVGEPA